MARMPSADPRDVLTRPAPPPDHTIRYGPGPEQIADIRLPGPASPGCGLGSSGCGPAPLILLLHGGFWRAAYDRTHLGPMATALAAAGYLVCIPEFRRVGQAGGGWPGTFDDVAAAVDTLPALVETFIHDGLDGRGRSGGSTGSGSSTGSGGSAPRQVLLAGHSAGGHLALWAAGRHRLAPGQPWRAARSRPLRGVVALAAVSDLVACHAGRLDDDAAAALLGGSPEQYPHRYTATNPASLVPLDTPLRAVHGTADDRVPCAMSRAFIACARDAGDDAELSELPGTGHFEIIDPLSAAWPAVMSAFRSLAVPG